MQNPLCYILMPSAKKPDSTGAMVDFDAVYKELVVPAIQEAGLEPLRADEEMTGGIINKTMFEQLILCDFAVADLTTANANVFYELGLRVALRPGNTVLLFAEGGVLPFDVAIVRALPYQLDREGKPADLERVKEALVKRLMEARKAPSDKLVVDSPVFQLVENFPEIAHTKTDVFRDRAQYSPAIKKRLAQAREQGLDAVAEIEKESSPIDKQEAGVVIDIYLSYRALKGWKAMIELVEKMSRPLAATVMVQEQYALALNRNGEGERAEEVLLNLLESRGPSSETYAILGRVYKDRWEAAGKAGPPASASGLLDQAIQAYLCGFEADWRDAFPGVNAVTLMELREPPDARQAQLIPLVSYAVERRMATGKPDYWDYATCLELAVLANDEQQAIATLATALGKVREAWEPQTTARNLRLIREARERRQVEVSWLKAIEEELTRKAGE